MVNWSSSLSNIHLIPYVFFDQSELKLTNVCFLGKGLRVWLFWGSIDRRIPGERVIRIVRGARHPNQSSFDAPQRALSKNNSFSMLMVVRCWTRAYCAIIICRGPCGILRRSEPLKGTYGCFFLGGSGGQVSWVLNLGKVYIYTVILFCVFTVTPSKMKMQSRKFRIG